MFFFFNDTATTEIYTLSLHDALPICRGSPVKSLAMSWRAEPREGPVAGNRPLTGLRSEEHTSELQSQSNLVCRLLLEKKKKAPKLPSTPHVTQTSDRSHEPALDAAGT